MASRKEQKEQARAARLAAETELRARAQRMRRIQLLVGAVVIAVAVIAVAVAVSSGGGNATPGNSKQDKATVAAVSSEIAGIPQTGTTLGDPSAKVTLTYFGDLECPICAEFTTTPDLLPQFIQSEVKTGVAKVTYRSLCTATCNDEGQTVFNTQQADAYAAGKQDLFWDYAELFYREQQAEGSGYATPAFFRALAAQTPKLKLATWETDTKDPALLAQVQADENAAAKLPWGSQQVGTPALLMTGPKGSEFLGSGLPTSFSILANAVKAVS